MRQRLDDWRKGNARGVAFPDKLWRSAGRLGQRHGIYVTARALGLEYNKLKRVSGAAATFGGGSKARAARKAVKFIELAGALPVSTSGCRLSLPVSTSGCRLSLQGPNGERLQLEMAPSAATEVVLQLCRSGWAASP
jgi:hypothetical protein